MPEMIDDKNYDTLSAAFDDGFRQGEREGHEQGYEEGREDGRDDGYEDGYNDGQENGFEDGYSEGKNSIQSYLLKDFIFSIQDMLNATSFENNEQWRLWEQIKKEIL